jgi:hypothetical protein
MLLVEMPPAVSILSIQKSWCSPLLTVKFLRLEMAKMDGAMSLGFTPSSQGACEKLAMRPSPMVMVVAA